MKTLSFLVLALVLGPLLFYPHTTGPTEVGVRTIKWSLFGKKGVEDHVYQPGGVYFFPAVINDWHVFETRLQNVEMTFDPKRGDRSTRDDLIFKTIDGNDISLDVIISYRIDPQKAPQIVQSVASSDFELKDNVVRTIARSRSRDIFGELKTEEFYIADKRDEKAERVKATLNEVLQPYGVIVERVSTKDYRFNPAYQKAIEDKKVAEQVAEQNKAATKAAEEEYLKKLEDAKGEVNKMVAEADGRFRQAQIEADAYYEKQQRIAAAIEAEGVAEAKSITEMNRALTGSGGEVMVKLKLAEALEGKKILLLPLSGGGMDIKTTDINRLLETYGVRSLTQTKTAQE
ncbi:MAG TPA: SPFH domain-containing protein [Methylomirabilota bacterium]|jgi:regulator of protease activity HflC (stomatin/prohibitin superfamily)|nr:SPFH domain-containing protein [Methylomirabilota bacterium]